MLRIYGLLAEATSFDGEAKQAKQRGEERARPAKLTAVPARFAVECKAMQAANGDAAYVIGKDLPPAIRLHAAAAVDFHEAHPTVIERQPDEPWQKSPAPAGPLDTEQLAALDTRTRTRVS